MILYPPLRDNSANGIVEHLNTVAKLRVDDAREINNLNNKLVSGRLRTDRAAPASHSEIYANIDKLGDIVRTATYEYIVVNDAGILKWARQPIDVTW